MIFANVFWSDYHKNHWHEKYFLEVFKVIYKVFVFLSYSGNAASSTNQGRMTPSSLEETSEVEDTKKRKKTADIKDDDQASYQENFYLCKKSS